jgi:hypothetical protein
MAARSGDAKGGSVNFAHQSELFDPELVKPVTYIGAGSVGGWAIFFLAKLGVTDITVYDGDSVASHNVPMSVYGPGDVGMLKVHALAEHVKRMTGIDLKVIPRHYTGERLEKGAVMMSVDDMAARRLVWDQVKGKVYHPLFTDTRLAETFLDILTVQPWKGDDREDYEKTLFPGETAVRQTCGRHGVVHTTTRAAGIAVTNLANFWMTGSYRLRVAEQCNTLARII